MSFYDDVRIIDKALEETTTSANIAYLPSGFVPVRNALTALAKKKKKWKIKILDQWSKNQYLVVFEEALTVEVPKSHWAKFQKEMRGKISAGEDYEVDLSEYLVEQQEQDMSKLFRELEGALYEMLVQDPIKNVDENIETWIKMFGARRYVTSANILLKYETLEKDMQALLRNLKVTYGDDRGAVESLISTIKERRPLNTFDVFNRYENLIGSRVMSSHSGIDLTFEAYVSMSWVPAESIYIEELDVADEVGAYPDVKAVNNVLFPKGKSFSRKMFKILKDEIDVQAEKEKK
jgi:hypothetical protein